jgi:homoserine kinase
MTPQTFRIFAPASVANVACGFDVLGFALEHPGDEVVVRRRDAPGVEIALITGDDGRLPRSAERNSAGVAVTSLLQEFGSDAGIELELHKQMPLSSGLGSSGASAVAAVVATDRLLGLGAPLETLLMAAMAGEAGACGSAHADNVAPSLYGGLVLVRPGSVPDVVRLPVPEGLTAALVRPHTEVETRAAREVLGDSVPLKTAVAQWANLGAFVAGLFRGDFELLSRALVDHVAEPKRGGLVPGFAAAQRAALDAGALGSSLSGSGPSIFALCRSRTDAERVVAAMAAAVLVHAGLECDRFVSALGAPGARVVEEI